jgi:hypothetical protein
LTFTAATISGVDVHHHSVASLLFQASNVAIVAGYLSIPFLVLPYLPLPRRIQLVGAGFFIGCAGTHVWMSVMGHDSWLWALWHLVQAGCTWGFILGFRSTLRSAHLRRRPGGGGRR